MRKISYVQALNEALHQSIAVDDKIFLIGQGVNSPWYAGNSTVGLVDRFGEDRILDTPISENCVTGAAIGAALAGMRPVLFFARMDFMLYAVDQIVNQAANWHYMFGSRLGVPLTIWAVINRGGEQAAQHSQALQAMFMHIPGLKVIMPSTPYDVKGLLLASIYDNNPVVFIDERWLYQDVAEVPEEMYSVPIGKGAIRCVGDNVTVAASSYMVGQSLRAAESLKNKDISVEVIDLRSLKPLDEDLLVDSVKKTGKLIITDGGWRTCGAAAEISALVTEKAFRYLTSPIVRIALPDAPAPASRTLEEAYYPTATKIVSAIEEAMQQ